MMRVVLGVLAAAVVGVATGQSPAVVATGNNISLRVPSGGTASIEYVELTVREKPEACPRNYSMRSADCAVGAAATLEDADPSGLRLRTIYLRACLCCFPSPHPPAPHPCPACVPAT